MAFFSITLISAASGKAASAGPVLGVQSVRSTTKWLNDGAKDSDRVQIVEVIVNNLAYLNASVSDWVTSNHTVSLASPVFKTVAPATFRRLRTDDQVTLLVGIQNVNGVKAGTSATATVVVKDETGKTVALATGSQEWHVTAGIPDWRNTDPSLDTHETPEWVRGPYIRDVGY